MTTPYHARYFAYELTRQAPVGSPDRLSMSLFDATVDLNPHQIEAALFALQSPLSNGALLADEVGLGKTIEAGIVLCQLWAEHKRRLLVICPASIRKQWALELQEKFTLPVVVLDSRAYRKAQAAGNPRPFDCKSVIIVSMNYANHMREELRSIAWDLAVVDEAHKLRNCYRPSNKMGQGIRWMLEDRKKLLLTATPLQNSLLELFGLSTLIDEHIFGDIGAFRSQYVSSGSDLGDLRNRLNYFCKRTLRRQVLEYIQYTERRAITFPFKPTEQEHKLYEAVSEFLKQDDSYAIPHRQRHLTVLVLYKLLASSSHAIAQTLDTMRGRLEALRDDLDIDVDLAEQLIEEEEIEDELLDDLLDDDISAEEESDEPAYDKAQLKREIEQLRHLATWARSIGIDTKTRALLQALDTGFQRMVRMGAARKALVFTESRRTQEYLKTFLESNGYQGQVVMFNGSNTGLEAKAIYERWVANNEGNGRASGSRQIDGRTALIEHFRDDAPIMIATEAAAEGINLQFCSLVINYDLPWNPQRIEQRIGRCHRYGQKHDVVVVNFLNERNEADRRVFDLLNEKFNLFSGLFGASDEVLGTIESGMDFEKQILAIYLQCRTPAEIDAAFKKLQEEMDERIKIRMDDTRQILFEHFDEDVHHRLRMQLENAKSQLDLFGKRFWTLTRFMLDDRAKFDEQNLSFDLERPPRTKIRRGRYYLISKSKPKEAEDAEANPYGYFLYRLSHPLGEHVIDAGKTIDTPMATVTFDVTNHPAHIAAIEALRGRSGYLTLTLLAIESFEREEYLLFSGIDDNGRALDQETCEKLFNCVGRTTQSDSLSGEVERRLPAEANRHVKATISKSLEANNEHFNEVREQLERWADDMVLAAEKALKDTKEQIKALRRQARQAETLKEQHEIQEKLRSLQRKQRRQRQDIFNVEDEIVERRDQLIERLEKRLSQGTETQTLFTIRWAVV